jgi:dienelactone hydrolase
MSLQESNNVKDENLSEEKNIKEEQIHYKIDGENYKGVVYYDENQSGKRPGIIVVHEWWGLNDYSKSRAKQLAGLGYISMAVDVFGNGEIAEDPTTAQRLAMPFYKDPLLTRKFIDAAIDLLKTYPQTDEAQIGAIGYCFGGFVVLNAAKLGADLKGVVSFHGGLNGVEPKKGKIKAKILVCHGAEDEFENSNVEEFKNNMNKADVDYDFKVYPHASHAFSNPNATEKGKKHNMPIKYNEAAAKASWNDMKEFFQKLFSFKK